MCSGIYTRTWIPPCAYIRIRVYSSESDTKSIRTVGFSWTRKGQFVTDPRLEMRGSLSLGNGRTAASPSLRRNETTRLPVTTAARVNQTALSHRAKSYRFEVSRFEARLEAAAALGQTSEKVGRDEPKPDGRTNRASCANILANIFTPTPRIAASA